MGAGKGGGNETYMNIEIKIVLRQGTRGDREDGGIKLRCNLSLCLQSKPEGRAGTCGYPCSLRLKQPAAHPGVFILPWDGGELRFGMRLLSSGVL